MKVYDAANVRNVALVGHSGSGKTQLAAALLFDAGAVNRFGKVDEGTTVTDSDEEEIARKHTLSASLAWCEWNKTEGQSDRHARDGEFPERRARRAARGGCRRRRHRRGAGRRGADREGLAGGRSARPAASSSCSIGSTASARASSAHSPPCARPAAASSRPSTSPSAKSAGSRRRGPRLDEGIHLRDRRQAESRPKVTCLRTWPMRRPPPARRSSRWSPRPTMR